MKNYLSCSRFVASPNCDERPENIDIDLIVIHAISLPPRVYGGSDVEAFFQNKLDFTKNNFYKSIDGLKVSAHLFIKRSGEIIQFVPFNKRAWHAGVSTYKNRDNCNDFSIGIELEGYHDDAYTKQQYRSLKISIKEIMTNFDKITKENIVGHSDIAPERKKDPGSKFDWEELMINL
jgi:AmpD protein